VPQRYIDDLAMPKPSQTISLPVTNRKEAMRP